MDEINVLSLFDGMSCGQIALNKLGIKVNNYFASEIDKYAMQVTKHNYPNTKHIGDVTKVKGAELPKIDLLIGGSPCFVKGTPIICLDDIKGVESISVGDFVLTHNNRYRKVLRVGSEEKEIYSLLAQGSTPTETTSNHPYYVRKRHRVWDNIRKTYTWIFDEPVWVSVENISKGDYVGTPILKTNINEHLLSEDECFLLGVYIGDAHTHQAEFSCKRLVELAETYCGIGAENKHFSKMLLDLPINLLKKVIEGYEFADGSFRKNTHRATTISKSLVQSLSLAIAKVYQTTCCIEYTERPKKTVIEGREVNQKNTWTISYRKEHKKQSRAYVLNDVVWNPIKSVIKTEKTSMVYNIEVEGDNSYIANNHMVHNCQGFSFAGKQLNFEDSRSKLFFEFVRLLEETKPKYFLLENVLMKKEYENIITEYLGVEPIFINSALVSAQNRKRLYWTNIPNITQPMDKGITWGDVREHGVNADSYYYTEQAMQWLARVSQKKKKPLTVHSNNDKMQMLEASHHKKYSNQRFFGIVDLPANEQTVAAMRGRYIINGKRQDGKQKTQGLTKQYIEFRYDGKTNALTTVTKDNVVVPFTLPDRIPVEEFFFRYITPLECERLQTVPDNYTNCVSNTQRYKMLGNGWTIDVIAHILSYAQL